MAKAKKILMVFDLPRPPEIDEDFEALLRKNKDYRDERDVLNALNKLGYNVHLHGVYEELDDLVQKLKADKWQLVFVMCESFRNERNLAPHVVALVEMSGLKYAGANSTNLHICRDKALTKKILKHHNILVPDFKKIDIKKGTSQLSGFPFPAIVKPMNLESSEGITAKSIVRSPKEAIKRAQYVAKKWNTDVIIEEYIDGRELYVGVVGNKKIQTFPPRELMFRNLSPSVPRIASYRVKWDLEYKKSLGIDSAPAYKLDSTTLKSLDNTCKAIYQALDLRGYARLDLRMSKDGQLYFIEANPNPAINRFDDFASAARNAGLAYETLIEQIVKLGIAA